VTGASSGFGEEFVRLLASEGYDVVLVARSGQAMEDLAQYVEERYRVEAIVLVKDLGVTGAAHDVIDNLRQRRHAGVDVLVNNAGFTQFGRFAELPEAEMLELLGVNVVALTTLTRLLLPGMVERDRGIVINMSSNAAFQPGPLMAAYYASKAYVLQLSLALAEEVRGTGVSVTALCPGPTETGFQTRAGIHDSKLVQGRVLPNAGDVVEWGWAQAKAGKPFAVHGARWRAAAFGTRLLPRSTAGRLAMRAQRRVDG
jgi:short-subunit dehydrogenase